MPSLNRCRSVLWGSQLGGFMLLNRLQQQELVRGCVVGRERVVWDLMLRHLFPTALQFGQAEVQAGMRSGLKRFNPRGASWGRLNSPLAATQEPRLA